MGGWRFFRRTIVSAEEENHEAATQTRDKFTLTRDKLSLTRDKLLLSRDKFSLTRDRLSLTRCTGAGTRGFFFSGQSNVKRGG